MLGFLDRHDRIEPVTNRLAVSLLRSRFRPQINPDRGLPRATKDAQYSLCRFKSLACVAIAVEAFATVPMCNHPKRNHSNCAGAAFKRNHPRRIQCIGKLRTEPT